ncbi:hypothetical protein ACFL2M_00665 [Patescibacteria group bacterium]
MTPLFRKEKEESEVANQQDQQEAAIGTPAVPTTPTETPAGVVLPEQPALGGQLGQEGAPTEVAPAPAVPEIAPPPEMTQPEQPPVGQEAPVAEGAPPPRPGAAAQLPTDDAAAGPAIAPAPAAPKTKTRAEIEELLSDGLSELYQGMSAEEQQKFREKGEEAAGAIEEMVGTFKATAQKVIEIIRGWLSTIPRVNKYFLEQESKLKTDDIMKLQRKMKKDRRIKVSVE